MQLFPLRLIPEKTNFDFIGKRWWGFAFSMAFTVAAIFIIMTRGLNMGIDFTGGILMEARTAEAADLSQMREALDAQDFGEVSLQNLGSDKDVLIRIQADENAKQSVIVEKVKAALGEAVEYRRVDYVGPTVGRELVNGSILAVLFSFGAMMAYLWFRFEWQFGVGAVASLIHDAVMMLGFYAFTRFEFSLTSVAAVLTVIGYSVNDSVVIYDRIRENLRKFRKMPVEQLLNASINDTLARTVVTSLTTLLAALALALFGGEVLRGFSFALVFGIIVGTYSSIFISAPALIYLKLRPGDLRAQSAAA